MPHKIAILNSSSPMFYPASPHNYIGSRFLAMAIFIFLLLCVFDPSDKLLGLKLPVFVFIMLYGIFLCSLRKGAVKLPYGLVLYVFLIVSIPILSIGIYFFIDGSMPFEGFQMAKAYVFISFAILLYLAEINIMKPLSIVLTMLSFLIMIILAILLYEPSLYLSLYSFGHYYGIFYLANRYYGSDLNMSQIYFATSPMLVIPIAYYFYQAKISEKKKLIYYSLVLLNIAAMFIAGTRNNMAISLLLPLTLYFLFSRKRTLSIAMIFITTGIVLVAFYKEIGVLLAPDEVSNYTKLALVNDYIDIFSDSTDLLFGQGLGSYIYWPSRNIYYYISELTYFEIIRNFGLILGLVMFFLLIYPIIYGFLINKKYNEKHIVIAYAFYLVMCFTNPNMFSSMGMLILAAIITNIFLYRKGIIKSRSIN